MRTRTTRFALVLTLTAVLTLPSVAASRDDNPGRSHRDRSVISRLIDVIAHLLDDTLPDASLPIVPHP